MYIENNRFDGDVHTVADTEGFGTADLHGLIVQVRLPGLLDNDHVAQKLTVTRDQNPSYLLGVLEWGWDETYQAIDVLLDRVTVTPGRCTP